MKTPKLELTGKQFGRITITGKATKPRTWVGTCDCSPETPREFNGSRLANGKIDHCGCQRVSHGHTAGGKRSPTYIAWQDMIARCKAAAFVGEDGQTVYPRRYSSRWRTFDGFLKEMGERPPGTTLDRIDTLDGSYIKSNCRWATRQQQDYNKTNNVMYFLGSDTQIGGSALDWAEHFSKRLNVPMSVDEFKTIVKFFTVEQMWCSIHPSALNSEQLRQKYEQAKTRKFFDDYAEYQRNHPVEYEAEDTGYVPEDYPVVVDSKTEAETATAEAPVWDDGETLAQESFKRNPRVRPDC